MRCINRALANTLKEKSSAAVPLYTTRTKDVPSAFLTEDHIPRYLLDTRFDANQTPFTTRLSLWGNYANEAQSLLQLN
jgi:hypothetical protein